MRRSTHDVIILPVPRVCVSSSEKKTEEARCSSSANGACKHTPCPTCLHCQDPSSGKGATSTPRFFLERAGSQRCRQGPATGHQPAATGTLVQRWGHWCSDGDAVTVPRAGSDGGLSAEPVPLPSSCRRRPVLACPESPSEPWEELGALGTRRTGCDVMDLSVPWIMGELWHSGKRSPQLWVLGNPTSALQAE